MRPLYDFFPARGPSSTSKDSICYASLICNVKLGSEMTATLQNVDGEPADTSEVTQITLFERHYYQRTLPA
jgi:hypothetical protein